MKRARICILLALALVFVLGFGSTALAADDSGTPPADEQPAATLMSDGPDLSTYGKIHPYGSITVIKTINSENGDPQPGITFKLFWGKKQLASGVTGADGQVIFNVYWAGQYVVVEEVPTGYTSSWSDNDKHVNMWKPGNKTERVVNYENPGSICIDKRKGSAEGDPMEGITFTLFVGEEQIASGATDAEGKLCFEELPPGTYILVEDVPSGYKTSLEDNQQITVTPGETVSITVINKKKSNPEPRDERKVRWPDRTPPPEELESASVELPHTGGFIEWELLALAGGMLASGGGALYLARRRKMKK